VTASPAHRLRELLGAPEILVLPGAADALTARIIVDAGFDAVYATGAGFANAGFGLPDVGLISSSEVVEHVRRICDVVDVPVVVDADTGYGGVLNVHRTVRALERAGAAAIQLEDQVEPKRCGHFDGQTVVPTADMVDRLTAALDARSDPDLVIIARTDAREREGFEAALERAVAYAEAGADVVFFEAPRSREELAAIPQRVGAPCLVNVVEGGKTPMLAAAELQELGFRIALYPNTALRVAAHAVQGAMVVLREQGTTESLMPRMLAWSERQRLVGLADAQEREARYLGKGRV
jgi:2-methylisocitrate lyase-like PEP mutase family enzyme